MDVEEEKEKNVEGFNKLAHPNPLEGLCATYPQHILTCIRDEVEERKKTKDRADK